MIFVRCRNTSTHLRLDDQIDVALAVAQLGIAERVVHFAVLLLDDRQRPQRLAQQLQLLAVDRQLAGFGDERESAHADDVAYVEQLLEDLVVERRFGIPTPAHFVALDVDLYLARMVLQLEKRRAAHDTAREDAPRDRYVGEVLLFGPVLRGDLRGRGGHLVPGGRIGVDSQLAQLRERVAADLFLLFTEFCDAHGGFFQNLIPAQMYENSQSFLPPAGRKRAFSARRRLRSATAWPSACPSC